jgi:hypothetical protein
MASDKDQAYNIHDLVKDLISYSDNPNNDDTIKGHLSEKIKDVVLPLLDSLKEDKITKKDILDRIGPDNKKETEKLNKKYKEIYDHLKQTDSSIKSYTKTLNTGIERIKKLNTNISSLNRIISKTITGYKNIPMGEFHKSMKRLSGIMTKSGMSLENMVPADTKRKTSVKSEKLETPSDTLRLLGINRDIHEKITQLLLVTEKENDAADLFRTDLRKKFKIVIQNDKDSKKESGLLAPPKPKTIAEAREGNTDKGTYQDAKGGALSAIGILAGLFGLLAGIVGVATGMINGLFQFKFLTKIPGIISSIPSVMKLLGKLPILGKLLSKGALKRIPWIGSAINFGEAIMEFQKGQNLQGALSVLAGVANLFPGVGTVISIAIDGIKWLMQAAESENPEEFETIGGAFKAVLSKLGDVIWLAGEKIYETLRSWFDLNIDERIAQYDDAANQLLEKYQSIDDFDAELIDNLAKKQVNVTKLADIKKIIDTGNATRNDGLEIPIMDLGFLKKLKDEYLRIETNNLSTQREIKMLPETYEDSMKLSNVVWDKWTRGFARIMGKPLPEIQPIQVKPAHDFIIQNGKVQPFHKDDTVVGGKKGEFFENVFGQSTKHLENIENILKYGFESVLEGMVMINNTAKSASGGNTVIASPPTPQDSGQGDSLNDLLRFYRNNYLSSNINHTPRLSLRPSEAT